ncbi:MAG: hypothetical protein IJ087_12685 [Eggerthellaceae bacterium]|nr:hypothetical protein [Eggerthellaceae bacterium]
MYFVTRAVHALDLVRYHDLIDEVLHRELLDRLCREISHQAQQLLVALRNPERRLRRPRKSI